ncbi:ATP-grasp domain-containing protein [Cochlodiniinecator piscidefendens]|uniref:ATP-grasp domain-containing protein n=1 Tax=Cochlodiniinecator piscidefendens TaxID=2715756 RepID=UPI00140C3887|nr:ATP-grasp domain-containing protein [Cochlodiniinecator piscidefendens]
MMKPRLIALNIARWLTRQNAPAALYTQLLRLQTRLFLRKNTSPITVILSIGKEGHSYSAARAAKSLGLKVCLVSPSPMLPELAYADYVLTFDPRTQSDEIVNRLKPLSVEGVAISARHVILPAQIKISEALGCISAGETSSRLCNDKFAWRRALEQADIPQPMFSQQRNELIDVPCIQKPMAGTGSKGVVFLSPGTPVQQDQISQTTPGADDDLYFEEYVDGRQFDIDGVSHNGVHKTVNVTHEVYENTNGTFPPKSFRFNTRQPDGFLEEMERAAFEILDASGVVHGAWHVEMRYRDGQFLPIDFANRLPYERFLSRASGVDVAMQHVAAYVPRANPPFELKPREFLQFFATTQDEKSTLRHIIETHPDSVFDAQLEPFLLSGIPYEAMVVLEGADYDTFEAMIAPLKLKS